MIHNSGTFCAKINSPWTIRSPSYLGGRGATHDSKKSHFQQQFFYRRQFNSMMPYTVNRVRHPGQSSQRLFRRSRLHIIYFLGIKWIYYRNLVTIFELQDLYQRCNTNPKKTWCSASNCSLQGNDLQNVCCLGFIAAAPSDIFCLHNIRMHERQQRVKTWLPKPGFLQLKPLVIRSLLPGPLSTQLWRNNPH